MVGSLAEFHISIQNNQIGAYKTIFPLFVPESQY